MARARRQNPPFYNLPSFNCAGDVVFRHHQPEAEPIATCIGCGCTDDHACVTAPTLDALATELQACFWVKVDRGLKIGVCSECVEKVEEFENRVLASRGGAEMKA